METVGQIIRAKRESLGLLLRQVASYLDIDQAILSKIERNERKPSKDNIIKLAEILKLDKEDLLVQFMSEKMNTMRLSLIMKKFWTWIGMICIRHELRLRSL